MCLPMTNSHDMSSTVADTFALAVGGHVPADPLATVTAGVALTAAALAARRRAGLRPFTPSDDAGLVARARAAGRSVDAQRRVELFTHSH